MAFVQAFCCEAYSPGEVRSPGPWEPAHQRFECDPAIWSYSTSRKYIIMSINILVYISNGTHWTSQIWCWRKGD